MPERVLCVMGKLSSGGVESMVFSYYSALDKNKYQYDIVYEKSTAEVPEELVRMGARFICISSMSHPVRYISELRSIIKKGNYRIIHCNNSTLSLFPLFAALTCGTKIRILHNHTTSSKIEKKRDLAKRFLRSITPKLADKWCACSEIAGRWMYGDKAFESGKVTVLRNAVDTEKYRYDKNAADEIRRELNIENKTVLGHIGRFVTVKNQLFLIDIFREYKKINNDSVLVIVGEGPEEEKLKSYTKETGVEDSVIFTGVRSDANKMYSVFDIFLLPSLYEGLPVVSVEASASGVYQLLSENITKECKITDAVTYLPIEKASVWATEIDSHLGGDRTANYEIVENSMFNIKNAIRELEKFYDDCLEEL